MTCVIFFFSRQYIDSLDLIARAPSAPILSDNGILATGLYAHRRALVFADQKSTRWLMHSCYGRLVHADGIGGPQNQAARISQRTCHAKFALTLGLRNQTTKYFSLPISQILSPYLPSFLARSLALSLSPSLFLKMSTLRISKLSTVIESAEMKLLFDAIFFSCVLVCFGAHTVDKIDAGKIERDRDCACVCVCVSVQNSFYRCAQQVVLSRHQ